MNDLGQIIGLTLGACGAVGLIGVAALHLLRRGSVRRQLMLAILVPVLAVVATVAVNVRFMFLSTHDSGVVLLALVLSSVLALMAAWAVLRRIMAALSHLDEGLHRLVTEADPAGAVPAGGATAEPPEMPQDFAQLATELNATRQTLAQLREREHRAERARRELIGFLSHDLRTPLSGLRALAEALEDGVITDVPRALAHLQSTVDRMSGLVEDLFALSRVEVSTGVKRATPVSASEIVADVVSELGGTAAAQQVDLVVELPARDRLAVLGAADDLTRALTNLVVNAIRHTGRGQQVRIQGRRAAEGQVQLAVLDACGGIPAENLTRVFETGWRGSSAGHDDGSSGLGLAIARGVANSHRGRIAVRNIEGGCRFELDLPPLRLGATS